MDQPTPRLDTIEHRVNATPDTLAEIDARIAAEHASMEAAIDSGQDGLRDWYVLDIERLENVRRVVAAGQSPTLDALIRMRLRGLSARYAGAMWSGDTDKAAGIAAEIDRLERGQV